MSLDQYAAQSGREKETKRWREGKAFQSGGEAPPAEKGKHPGINCGALGPSRLRAGL